MDRFIPFLLIHILLYFAVFADSTADPGCPLGYSSNDTKICYKVYSTPLSNADAVKQCTADGGALSKVVDEEANAYIYSLTSDANIKLLWLGIDCENNSTDCTFEELGTVNYTNFYEENPAPIGSCVYMSGKSATAGKWFLFVCAQAFPYVCETDYGKQCPNGYKKYRDNCYRFVEEAATHIDAVLACEKDCGNLASIRSEAEAQFATGLAVNVTDRYRLIRIDNSSTKYIKKGYQDPHVGSCFGLAISDGVIKQGQWSNINCEIEVPYICQTGFKSINAPCSDTDVPVYTSVDCKSPQKLKGAGIIYSLGWPASLSYSEPTECIYYIVTPPGTVTKVSFPVLKIPMSTTISLYNDMSTTTPFAEITANTEPSQYEYQSSLNQMMIIVSNHKTEGLENKWQMIYRPSDNVLSCPTGYTHYDKMCYLSVRSPETVSREQAYELCKKQPGGSLVAIKDEITSEFLKRFVKSTNGLNYLVDHEPQGTHSSEQKFEEEAYRQHFLNGWEKCTTWNGTFTKRHVQKGYCKEEQYICQAPLQRIWYVNKTYSE